MPRFDFRTLREWTQRLHGTFRRGRPDGDLEEELRLHQDLAAEDARRRGAPPDAVGALARIRVGGGTQALEAARDQRGVPWLDDFLRDLRYAVRMLRRTPAFTAVALCTLALGIGATTAIYQLFDAIRLRTLPVTDPQQIAVVELADLTRWQGRRTTRYPVLTNPLWEQFRDRQEVFSGRVGLVQRRSSDRSRGGDPPCSGTLRQWRVLQGAGRRTPSRTCVRGSRRSRRLRRARRGRESWFLAAAARR